MILNLRSRPNRGKFDSSLQLIRVHVVKQMASRTFGTTRYVGQSIGQNPMS